LEESDQVHHKERA